MESSRPGTPKARRPVWHSEHYNATDGATRARRPCRSARVLPAGARCRPKPIRSQTRSVRHPQLRTNTVPQMAPGRVAKPAPVRSWPFILVRLPLGACSAYKWAWRKPRAEGSSRCTSRRRCSARSRTKLRVRTARSPGSCSTPGELLATGSGSCRARRIRILGRMQAYRGREGPRRAMGSWTSRQVLRGRETKREPRPWQSLRRQSGSCQLALRIGEPHACALDSKGGGWGRGKSPGPSVPLGTERRSVSYMRSTSPHR